MARTAMSVQFGPCTHHWELEPNDNPFSLHAYGRRRMDA